jgi:hypothetical protein
MKCRLYVAAEENCSVIKRRKHHETLEAIWKIYLDVAPAMDEAPLNRILHRSAGSVFRNSSPSQTTGKSEVVIVCSSPSSKSRH